MIFLRERLGKVSLIQIISSIFDFEAYIYKFFLLIPVDSFDLAKNSLLGWEGTIGILLEEIGALGTAWGFGTLGSGTVENLTITKYSVMYLWKDLLFVFIRSLFHLDL